MAVRMNDYSGREVSVSNPRAENSKFRGLTGIANLADQGDPASSTQNVYWLELPVGPGEDDADMVIFFQSELELIE